MGDRLQTRITILVDVYAGIPFQLIKGLRAEYGFSALIEREDFQILFDTGLSGDVLFYNAERLGIKINPNFIVLSHGHSDHTGGLPKVLERVRAPIVAHPEVFKPKFAMVNGKLYEIGIPIRKHKLEEAVTLIESVRPLELAKGLYFSGEIPREWGPSHTGLVYTVDPARGVVRDEVKDDAAIYITTNKGLFILTGCGHSGVENIVEYGLKVTGQDKLYGIAGGLHLLGAKEERMKEVVDFLVSKGPQVVVPTHCTGQRAQYLLKKELGDAYVEGGPGVVIELP